MNVKKLIGQIHLWLGLLSGLVVFLLGITGCIYVFQSEIKEYFYSDRYFVNTTGDKVLPISELKEKAQAVLGEEYPITFFQYAPSTNYTYRFRASKSNPEALTYNSEVVYNKIVFINPYNGDVQYIENTKWEFFNVVLKLHYDLLLNKTGHQIVGWSSVIFIITLITGLVLWWPKNLSALKQRVLFKWKSTTRWKRKNYDLHNIPGFYSLILALCISLTGLWFAFEWFRPPVKWIANGGKTFPAEQKVFSDTTLSNTTIAIDLIEKSIREKSLQAGLINMSLPLAKDAPLTVTVMHNKDNFAKRSQYFFDRYTGKEVKSKPYEVQNSGDKFGFMIYDIHIGKILGLPGQILAFFAAIISASLPVTGFIIWRGRVSKKKNKVREIAVVNA